MTCISFDCSDRVYTRARIDLRSPLKKCLSGDFVRKNMITRESKFHFCRVCTLSTLSDYHFFNESLKYLELILLMLLQAFIFKHAIPPAFHFGFTQQSFVQTSHYHRSLDQERIIYSFSQDQVISSTHYVSGEERVPQS